MLQLPADVHSLCLHSAFQAEPGDTGDAERKEGCDVSPGHTGSPLHPLTAFELGWTHSPILPGRKTQAQFFQCHGPLGGQEVEPEFEPTQSQTTA